LYQFRDIHGAGGAAVIARRGVSAGLPLTPSNHRWLRANRSVSPDVNLVVDLGVDVGSARWLRGAATCALLCYGAWSMAPEAHTVRGVSPAPIPEAHREEARALSIAPLALGADTGKRAVPTDAVEVLPQAPESSSVALVATLGEAAGLARLLERSGVARADAADVRRMIAQHVPLDQLRPGTLLNLTLGRRPQQSAARPLDSLSFRVRLGLHIDIVRTGGRLAVRAIEASVDETPLRLRGGVGASLYRSARAAGVPAAVAQTYIRVLASHVDVGRLGPDDVFDLVIEYRRTSSGESEMGRLLYAGLQRAGGREIKLMEWTAGGHAQWFEASGIGRTSAGLIQPVPGRITSAFGYRLHPILGYRRFHGGLDTHAAHGTPILAATGGQVARAGWSGGYGNVVELRHSSGLATRYGHMSRIAVAPGQVVRQGQVIGYVGSTGLSTGPHLHYEMLRNGQLVDPRSVRWLSQPQLSGVELESFRNRMASYRSLPPGVVQPRRLAHASRAPSS